MGYSPKYYVDRYFKNLELEDFFKENNGENKILFAKKYIEIMEKQENIEELTPQWISKIKKYFS